MSWHGMAAVAIAFAAATAPAGCGGDTVLASNDGDADGAPESNDGLPRDDAADADDPDLPPADVPGDGDGVAADADADGDAAEAEAEAWVPPIDDAGEAGWRDSETPWSPPPVSRCDADLLFGAPLDLWCDADGVFVLHGWQEFREEPGGGWTPDGPPLLGVWANSGDGWIPYYRGEWSGCGPECDMQLGGILDGWLLGWMPGESVYGFAPGVMEPLWPELTSIGPDLVVVRDDLAYASWQAGGDARIVRWNGSTWSAIPAPLPFTEARRAHLWADVANLFVAGPYSILLSLEADDWRVHDAGSLANFTAIWGFAGDDVWVGGEEGVLKHYDGVSWTDVAWPSRETAGTCVWASPIHGMWGADGVLYFVTSTQFARWDGTEVEVLGFWPDRWDPDTGGGRCVPELRLVALWGNSPTEVFLAIARPSPEPSSAYCNDIAVLFWDGATFHWM